MEVVSQIHPFGSLHTTVSCSTVHHIFQIVDKVSPTVTNCCLDCQITVSYQIKTYLNLFFFPQSNRMCSIHPAYERCSTVAGSGRPFWHLCVDLSCKSVPSRSFPVRTPDESRTGSIITVIARSLK